MTVKVTSFGRDVQDLPFREKQTAQSYLESAEVTLGETDTLSVNGEKRDPTQEVRDGDTIVVAPKIKNG